jgi:ubiquitin carboxyl-terminal hydrolase L5
VWELDGLKSGPLEVGEIPVSESAPSEWASSSTHGLRRSTEGWMSAARPALRMKMQKYGGDNIKFSLLALVDDQYEVASDRLELCRRDRDALERRSKQVFGEDGWRDQVCIRSSIPIVDPQ